MERVAVLYDLQTLGKKDWYLWGAEILLCHQHPDGYWDDEKAYPGESPIVNTCFALLFLRRANLTPDLSKRLLVDTSVLTSKVENRISPPVAPYPHEVLPKPLVQTVLAPTPEPKVEPKVEPPPVPAVAAAPEPAPPPAKKTPWLWIILGVVFVSLLAGLLLFLLLARRKKKDEDEDDEEVKKPLSKKKTATKGPKKPRVKARLEEDDED
jgi:hypothetical protein